MNSFPDGVILITKKGGKVALINQFTPAELDFQRIHEDLMMNAFPKAFPQEKQSKVFAFTVDDTIAYTWSFKLGSDIHSIIVLSSKPYPSMFFDLLDEADKDCPSEYTQLNENSRFELIVSFIESWRFVDNEEILYSSIDQCRTVKPSEVDFNAFDPYHYFAKDTDYTSLWKAMLLNKGILVKGDDEESISRGVMSLVGLVKPFSFTGKILITNNKYDNRIFDTKAGYSIIGITEDCCKVSEFKRSFGEIISIDTKTGTNIDTVIIHKKQKLLFDLMLTIANRNLETNPYHELIGKRIVTDEIDNPMCAAMKKKTLTFPELRKFELTKTMSLWREERLYRSELRESFLSNDPSETVEKIESKDLPLTLSIVNQLKEMYPDDLHFQSVMRKHRRLIEAKIGIVNRRQSDSDV